MLNLTIKISGDKAVIDGLNQISPQLPGTIGKALKKSVRAIHPLAMAFLNGKGGLNSYETRTSKSGKTYQKKTGSKVAEYEGFTRRSGEAQNFRRFTDSGGYPVPVRTGNLKRLLGFVDPGGSLTSNRVTFSAASNEAIIFDSAEYAAPIHEGYGSSRKFGARSFISDAFEKFNSGVGVSGEIENEVSELIKSKGLQ